MNLNSWTDLIIYDLQQLKKPYARLYTAQTTSLLGDALTWVGIALLAFELAGEKSAVVLSSALTLRVTAFVLLSPLAGAALTRSLTALTASVLWSRRSSLAGGGEQGENPMHKYRGLIEDVVFLALRGACRHFCCSPSINGGA